MIELGFCKKNLSERKKIVKEYRIKNLEKRDKSKLDAINDWCKKYLNNVNGREFDFHSIIEALPEELLDIKRYLDSTYDVSKIMKELPYSKNCCYIETSLYTKMKIEAKNILLKNLNVIGCPYCNRNYVFSDKNINTCEMDHFIPKKKYPIFASSFYNLIPACPYCNRKKGDKEFKIYPHKHKKNTDELVKFTYTISGIDYLTKLEELDVKLETLDEDYLAQANILKLEDLYKHHKDIVQEVLKKRQIFSSRYIEGIQKEFPKLFETETDIEELIYGISMKREDYGKRPLSKMIYDIINEVKI